MARIVAALTTMIKVRAGGVDIGARRHRAQHRRMIVPMPVPVRRGRHRNRNASHARQHACRGQSLNGQGKQQQPDEEGTQRGFHMTILACRCALETACYHGAIDVTERSQVWVF